jgi:hypothetical protein
MAIIWRCDLRTICSSAQAGLTSGLWVAKAGGGAQRRSTLQEEVVAEAGRKQLESFRWAPWADRRRQDLLILLDRLSPKIAELSQAIEQEVEKCPEA